MAFTGESFSGAMGPEDPNDFTESYQGDDYVPEAEELTLLSDFRHNLLAGQLINNPTHEQLFAALDPSVPENAERWGVTITDTGAWAEVNPAPERARNPKQTFFVRDGEIGGEQGQKVYWEDKVGFQPLERQAFTDLVADSLALLSERTVYQTEKQSGSIMEYAFNVDTITDSPSAAAFSNNMFLDRDPVRDPNYENASLTVIVLPHDSDKINPADYGLENRLGNERTGLILTDPETGIVLIRGFAYHGPIKKTVFTLMNHYLPDMDVFPMHASANVGPDGDVAIYTGLSGTGKTSAVNFFEGRTLIGDDELLITPDGRTANQEGGIYPLMLGISEEKEPALFRASFTPRPPEENRAIFQNVVVGEDGKVDVDDDSLTKNSRVSVPLEYITGSKESHEGGPPQNIFFITKDVGGVLPPIAKLDPEQAMYWFLMGPTSKTAAENGLPGATFSRFFGSPFMSRHPKVYLEQLGDTLQTYEPNVWLINTGFTGGPENEGGVRIDIPDTKAMVGAALSGELNDVNFRFDERFKIAVPTEIPGSESATALLNARDTWEDPTDYDRRADAFAELFKEHFDKTYGADPDLASFQQFSPASVK